MRTPSSRRSKVCILILVDLFVVGTELDTTIQIPSNFETKWREIIFKVRAKYSGPITYSVSCQGGNTIPPTFKNVGFSVPFI